MRIEQLWLDMEDEAAKKNLSGWISRFALPLPTQPLLVAFDADTCKRALLLPLAESAMPTRRAWPECEGLEMFTARIAGEACFGIRLTDRGAADVFAALAEDVAPRVGSADTPHGAVTALLGRLRRWQRFLSAKKAGLDEAGQRGLYGELHTLGLHLIPLLGPSAALTWRAPKASHQDFQMANGAIEVKTTSAKQPQSVRVTSERQLDRTGIPALFLHIVILDERESGEAGGAFGDSLPQLVERIRSMLKADAAALESFEDGLLDSNYLAGDIPKYSNRRYALRKELTFRVSEGFPCIVEGALVNGVGNVAYDLALPACLSFQVDWIAVQGALVA